MSEASRARCMNSSVKGSVSQAIIAAPRARRRLVAVAVLLAVADVTRAALVDDDHAADEEGLAAEGLGDVRRA